MRDRYHISMLVPGMPFDGNTLDNASLGGSETAGLLMARELARMGHWVRMFCNTPHPGEYDGVHYRGIGDFMTNLQTVPGDVVIVQRTPEPFLSKSVHRLHVLWCHDLAQARQANAYRSVCWNVDSVITVSEWMRQQYLDAYGLPHGLVYASHNGLDLARFPKVNLDLKKRKRLVYAARPERGLDVMLDSIFPALIEKDPEFELAIFGYANMVEHLKEFYAGLADKAQQFGDKVRFVGTLAKGPQYRAYAESGIYAYPTPSPKHKDFSEVSCISAAEAQAAGMPIVTSNRGALSETIHPDAGTLIDGDPWTAGYCMDFVDAVLSYANDRDQYDRASQAGQAHAQTLGWDKIAEDWTQLFDRLIDERNDDRVRLVHHFYRRSDIIAAKQVLSEIDDPRAETIKAKIDQEYGFIASPETLKAHYVEGGKETTARLESSPIESYGPNFTETDEGRFHVIQEYLRRHPEAAHILDYGCGHGWSTIYLGNRLGREWVGVDLDPGAIAWAQKCALHHGAPHTQYDFKVGSIDEEGLLTPHSFDAVICSEVLEHCVDPVATFESIEKAVRLGGLCIITVPYGPAEYGTPNWQTFRNHLWEFDPHDLEDMFGDKPGYAMSSSPIYDNATTGEKVGFYFITFRADHCPIGKIDMARKLRLQRPRQTLSIAIMAGRYAEQTLGWCLDSVRTIADEIIIADTGLDPIGRAIANRYGAKLVPGSDPLKVGFYVPRNESLAACSMDWVFWIDADERLLDPAHIVKYLRASLWQGLGVKQHHLAVDSGFKPDMPVRCFRRGPFDRPENAEYHGRVMSFNGCLAGETEITTPRGLIPIKDLVGKRPWVYCYDHKTRRISLEQALWVRKTGHNKRLLAIKLDDGTVIRATHEHPFLMRKTWAGVKPGKYVRADELKVGDRLMLCYRKRDGRPSDHRRGWMICLQGAGMFRDEHRFVYEKVYGPIPDGYDVHHKDENPSNNDPSNLELLTDSEHGRLHRIGKKNSAETRRRISLNHAPCSGHQNSMWGREHAESTRALIGKRSRDRGAGKVGTGSEKGHFTSERASDMNRLSWANPVIRQKRIEGIRQAALARGKNHKIVAIYDGGIDDVYNIEMSDPNHNFAAGGVIVHNCLHEHPELGMNMGPGDILVLPDVHIAHVGYLNESGRRRRFARNTPLMEMDQEKFPERVLQKHFVMRDNMLKCSQLYHANGKQISEEMRRLATETVELYRKYFLGKNQYAQIDSLQYYTQALQILQQGVDLVFHLAAAKDGIGDDLNNGTPVLARFANAEEAKTELSFLLDNKFAPFQHRYW